MINVDDMRIEPVPYPLRDDPEPPAALTSAFIALLDMDEALRGGADEEEGVSGREPGDPASALQGAVATSAAGAPRKRLAHARKRRRSSYGGRDEKNVGIEMAGSPIEEDDILRCRRYAVCDAELWKLAGALGEIPKDEPVMVISPGFWETFSDTDVIRDIEALGERVLDGESFAFSRELDDDGAPTGRYAYSRSGELPQGLFDSVAAREFKSAMNRHYNCLSGISERLRVSLLDLLEGHGDAGNKIRRAFQVIDFHAGSRLHDRFWLQIPLESIALTGLRAPSDELEEAMGLVYSFFEGLSEKAVQAHSESITSPMISYDDALIHAEKVLDVLELEGAVERFEQGGSDRREDIDISTPYSRGKSVSWGYARDLEPADAELESILRELAVLHEGMTGYRRFVGVGIYDANELGNIICGMFDAPRGLVPRKIVICDDNVRALIGRLGVIDKDEGPIVFVDKDLADKFPDKAARICALGEVILDTRTSDVLRSTRSKTRRIAGGTVAYNGKMEQADVDAVLLSKKGGGRWLLDVLDNLLPRHGEEEPDSAYGGPTSAGPLVKGEAFMEWMGTSAAGVAAEMGKLVEPHDSHLRDASWAISNWDDSLMSYDAAVVAAAELVCMSLCAKCAEIYKDELKEIAGSDMPEEEKVKAVEELLAAFVGPAMECLESGVLLEDIIA